MEALPADCQLMMDSTLQSSLKKISYTFQELLTRKDFFKEATL
jgi:hypothetical protein